MIENKHVSFEDDEGEACTAASLLDEYGARFRLDQQLGGCGLFVRRAEQLGQDDWFVIQTPVRAFFVNQEVFTSLKATARQSAPTSDPVERLSAHVLKTLKDFVAISSGPSTAGVVCPARLTVQFEGGAEVRGELFALGEKTILWPGDEQVIVAAPSSPERLVLSVEAFEGLLWAPGQTRCPQPDSACFEHSGDRRSFAAARQVAVTYLPEP